MRPGGGKWRVEPDPRTSVLDAIWGHRIAVARGLLASLAHPVISEDVGEITVMRDQGDVIARANRFDLANLGVRFARNGQGGYDASPVDGAFRTTLGTRLRLGDDDSASVTVPFVFPFYAGTQTAAFVNSDGNLTFGEEDRASTERDLARVLTGPPRVAAFFADLDPSAGGSMWVNAAPDAFTVTWCGVPGFESANTTTVQATLLPDGGVEVKFGSPVSLTDAIVGVSPGRTGDFAAVDLSATTPSPGGADAVGERFAQRNAVDFVALARKFYATHPDDYDQLVVWTDALLVGRGAFAFASSVANEVRGIGVPIFDASRDFGSGGRLRTIVNMDFLQKYPDNPAEKIIDEDTTLSVLGQETGHRWLAHLRVRDHTGVDSQTLLGRDRAHWSFFLDSDASVMEGNDIDDLGGGSFRTVAANQRYSPLDQYAMGLRAEADVPLFFYVSDPLNMSRVKQPEDAPEVGVTFNGTRRTALIQDVVAVMGTRQPAAADSPRALRQAFIYVVSSGASVDQSQVDKVDRIRREWEAFFLRATDGRMRVETRLRAGS